MSVTRKVTVERNRLRFAAAHMATFAGDCEPLHGHNYDAFVEVEGDLTEDSWVWDFGDLKRATKAIIDKLDHKFVLQRDSLLLDIEEQEGAWVVSFGGRRYVFPVTDVIALPLDNSTAERIAEWVAGELLVYLRHAGAKSLQRLTIGIEEMPGQTGWYTVNL